MSNRRAVWCQKKKKITIRILYGKKTKQQKQGKG